MKNERRIVVFLSGIDRKTGKLDQLEIVIYARTVKQALAMAERRAESTHRQVFTKEVTFPN